MSSSLLMSGAHGVFSGETRTFQPIFENTGLYAVEPGFAEETLEFAKASLGSIVNVSIKNAKPINLMYHSNPSLYDIVEQAKRATGKKTKINPKTDHFIVFTGRLLYAGEHFDSAQPDSDVVLYRKGVHTTLGVGNKCIIGINRPNSNSPSALESVKITALHELGHCALGFNHCENTQPCAMKPASQRIPRVGMLEQLAAQPYCQEHLTALKNR